jgi:FAD/FMN-containing dehydrogenase
MKPIVSRMIDYEGVQFHGIDEFLDLKKQYQHVEYTVSWVDCTSTGRNFARGIFMAGDHSRVPGELKPSPAPKLVFPFEAPGWALNKASVSLFNTLYFHKQRKSRVKALQDYEPFFYPLDKVLRWNRLYGRNGLLQFQYALPWSDAKEGTVAILREIAKSGLASFLAVLKAFGDIPSLGMMSFPMAGIMFALDFPIKEGVSFPLLQRLGDMTREFGGRLYSAKDACMTPAQFEAFYPNWREFARYRDPMITSSYWERVTGEKAAV